MNNETGDVLPEGRRGQILAIGLVIIVAAFVWLGVAAPLIGWFDSRSDELSARRALLARMESRAQALPALRRLVKATHAEARPADSLLSGDSDAIAAATLQGVIQDMATTAGATLSSEEVLPAVQQGALRQIGLRIALSGRWPVLISLLQAIDASSLRLLVDDLEFHAVADGAPAIGAGGNHPPLQASFVVMAFRYGTGDRSTELQAQADELTR